MLGHISASYTTARATTRGERQSAVSTVTKLMIRSAVCARMTLAFLLHADWSAAAWVCKAAGARSADLGINILIFDVMITADRRAVASSYLDDPGAVERDVHRRRRPGRRGPIRLADWARPAHLPGHDEFRGRHPSKNRPV
jgi:hypothetical protein